MKNIKKYILIILGCLIGQTTLVAQTPTETIYCGGENVVITGCALGGVGVGTVYDVISNPDMLFTYDDCTPPPAATPPIVNASDGGWGLGSSCDPANTNAVHTILSFDYECDVPSGLPVPFNETCAPIDITVGYLIEFDYAGNCCDHDGVFVFCGAYTGTIIPVVVTIAPFYNIAQGVDYSGACGDVQFAIGIDNACTPGNVPGSLAESTLGDIDDCGGPDGSLDFDAANVCVLLTATLDQSAVGSGNPACYVDAPYTSPDDTNNDQAWDVNEIAVAAGLPADAASCIPFTSTYPVMVPCLQELTPPTFDYALTTPTVCSGGTAILEAGANCAGYEGYVDIDGDGFISPPNDKVSWQLLFFVPDDYFNLGTDCQDITALDLQPGLPTFALFDDITDDIAPQGYTLVEIMNEPGGCIDVNIPMPFNTTCAPIPIDIYYISFNGSVESDQTPGDLICNLGSVDPSGPSGSFTVNILPFYTLQATADYTGSCGNYYTGLGLDCNADGTMFTPEVLDSDDCGGEITATSDFQAGEACITFTATADLSGIVAANPACYVQAPLSSVEDSDGDGDWDGVDIAVLQGFPGDPVAEGCYGLIDTYPATTTCLQPLAPPVCDFMPTSACSGGDVIVIPGATCDGYNGVIDNDGDGFISPPNDCVSWDADVFISSDLVNAPTPGLPTISAPVTSGADVVAQGYTYIGTINGCNAAGYNLGALFANATCAPVDYELYVISYNYSYEYDETPNDLICNLGGYTPDGPGCAITVTVYPEQPQVFLINDSGTCGDVPEVQLGYDNGDGAGGGPDGDFDDAEDGLCQMEVGVAPMSQPCGTGTNDETANITLAAAAVATLLGHTDATCYVDIDATATASCTQDACPAGCPTVVAVDDVASVCDAALATEITTWQAAVAADATNAAAIADANTDAAIAYSTVVVPTDAAAPDGLTATGVHSGVDNCASEMQMTYAYLLCYGADATAGTADDSYLLLGSHTLTVYPDAQAPTDVVTACTNTPTTSCTGDTFSATATNPTGGASAANWDGTTYTAQPGDVAGTIDIIVTSGVVGSPGCATAQTIATPACPINCAAEAGTICPEAP